MVVSLDFERTPTEAEIRKIRVACRWMLLPSAAMALAAATLVVSGWNGDPGLRVWVAFGFTLVMAMGYQFYLGSLPCPRCGRSVLDDSMTLSLRFLNFGDLRCGKCGLSFAADGSREGLI